MKLTPEQLYRLENAKERTPSTNEFILWIPLFVFIAWLCGVPSAPEQTASLVHVSNVSHYETDILTVFGWHIL